MKHSFHTHTHMPLSAPLSILALPQPLQPPKVTDLTRSRDIVCKSEPRTHLARSRPPLSTQLNDTRLAGAVAEGPRRASVQRRELSAQVYYMRGVCRGIIEPTILSI